MTVLTATMIGGLLTIVALLVIRFSAAPAPVLPESVALPEGAEAQAVTVGQGWIAVVTRDQRILIFDRRDGALRQDIPVDLGE